MTFESLKKLFIQPEWLDVALTHKSQPRNFICTTDKDNERLEFLGDSVVQMMITELLYLKFPFDNEGVLSKLRAGFVGASKLAEISKSMELDKHIHSETMLSNERILSSLFEAVVGALYLDQGKVGAYHFVKTIFEEFIPQSLSDLTWDLDYKTRLQEWTQAQDKSVPIYLLKEESGPDHEKEFIVEVTFLEHKFQAGSNSIKQAGQLAAKNAIETLKIGANK